MQSSFSNFYGFFFIVLFIKEPLIWNVNIEPSVWYVAYFFAEAYFFLFACQNVLFRYVITNKFSVSFGILILYHWINLLTNNATVGHRYFTFIAPLFENYVILNLCCFLFLKDSQKAFKFILAGYLLFCILAFNVSHLANNRLTGAIHSNQFAQCAGMILLLLTYMKYQLRLSYLTVGLLALPFVFVIVKTGSRNGFILLLIFALGLLLSKMFSRRWYMKDFTQIVCLITVIVIVNVYLMNETFLGKRLLNTEAQADAVKLGTGTVLDKLGDRGFYYVVGWENFLEHPLFGIGLGNFPSYNKYIYPLHSEYMIHLCEGGIVGFILYSFFLFFFSKGVVNAFREDKNEYTLSLVMIWIAYLVVGITAREFYYSQFYPPLGLCMYFILKNRLVTKLQKRLNALTYWRN